MANNAFGIDLGTRTIKIYNTHGDSVVVEKNMIAIEDKKNLFAYGDSAFEMFEKAPSNIEISYPLILVKRATIGCEDAHQAARLYDPRQVPP